MIIRTETQDKSNIGLVFWPGTLTLLGATMEQQLQAAVAGRFSSMAISIDTYRQALAAGFSARDIVELAENQGLQINQLDGVTSWPPFRFPAELPMEVRERFDVSPEEALDVAAELGISTVIAMGVFEKGELTMDELIPLFGDFCDNAQSRNLRVDIEPASMWGIPTLGMAWDIVRSADRLNAGLLIDTWHLQKGSPHFEEDLLLLETIPSERLATFSYRIL